MTSHDLENIIINEIREKITPGSQFIDVFSCWKAVKLDGTFYMKDLIAMYDILKKYEIDMECHHE